MSRVVHFELAADDPERATRFYHEVFGWQSQKWDGPQDYWLIKTGEEGEPGIDGAIMRRDSAGTTTVNTIDVSSVDEFVTKIEQAGGNVVAPKMPIPGIGYFAYCSDTEGNMFAIMQSDSSVS